MSTAMEQAEVALLRFMLTQPPSDPGGFRCAIVRTSTPEMSLYLTRTLAPSLVLNFHSSVPDPRVRPSRKNRGINSAFTVRKISYGEGVERIFPLYSPQITGIEVMRRGRVRRAKLYYLRGLTGKAARIAERRDERPVKGAKAAQAAKARAVDDAAD